MYYSQREKYRSDTREEEDEGFRSFCFQQKRKDYVLMHEGNTCEGAGENYTFCLISQNMISRTLTSVEVDFAGCELKLSLSVGR